MIVGIDPKVDYAFKHLFGRDKVRPLLVHLINSVLAPPPGRRIIDVELLNPFNPKESLDDKLSILDVKAREQNGRQFNLEMQMLVFRYYEKRVLYYWAKFHQQQLHEGQDYLQLNPTISISFLNHVMFPQTPEPHLHFRLLDSSQKVCFSDDIQVHILELPKFKKTPAELTSDLDIWLYFLRHAEMMDAEALPESLNRPIVSQALEELKIGANRPGT